jgi:NAD(P)-dependent dehydrogenase (short-subunit alcohol dehydrogenase family)
MGLVDGKSGLLTGAASGIGRARAIRFAAEGASVVVADLEARRGDGQETVRSIEQLGGQALFVAADVRSEEDQRRLVTAVVGELAALISPTTTPGSIVTAPSRRRPQRTGGKSSTST